MGNDFYIPLSNSNGLGTPPTQLQYEEQEQKDSSESVESDSSYTNGIIGEIRDLVSDISSKKKSNSEEQRSTRNHPSRNRKAGGSL
ncbi:hypothetical protein LguiB_027275 [Lonicera macranthoides]